ncbi:MAG: hypothetical protein QOE86_4208 [Solirubrobacteraceae bacterium]|jgi:uncharacterized protein (TIGR03663 family)|nr:hypothetical protein [Solirubrobacteraceae bacterium]
MTELTTPPAPAPDAAHARPGPVRRLATWLADRPRAELAIWAGLIVIAIVLRVWDLGARPFHHDESQDAYFSWVFYDHGDYQYQPILHGPLRFYLTALNFELFGDSNFTARLAPAYMGTIAVALPYLLRRQLGRVAALAAGVALAIGPTYLYFSRFAREDIYIAAITLGLIVALFRFLDRPRPAGPSIMAALLALSFATKESTFITGFVLFTFLCLAIPIQTRIAGGFRDGEIVKAVRSVGPAAWGYALAVFWIVFAVLFTVFLTQPGGLWAGIHDGLDYWLNQQPQNRGGEPWYFYLAVLFGEEWPVLLLGGVGIVYSLRHPTTFRLFLIWDFVVSLAVYSWASERFAWLAMHPLLPLILLAGIGVQALVVGRARIQQLAAGLVIAACVAYMAYASFLVNAEHGANPRELLVSTQSSTDVKREAERVLALNRALERRTGKPISITVDAGQGATFPYAWYFRHLPVGYIDMTTPNYVPSTQVLIMTEQARAKLLPDLAAYQGREFRFRVWWVRDWSKKFSLSAWEKYLIDRKTWNPTGGMPEWIYVRRDALNAAG